LRWLLAVAFLLLLLLLSLLLVVGLLRALTAWAGRLPCTCIGPVITS
jgi:hypothetical protein